MNYLKSLCFCKKVVHFHDILIIFVVKKKLWMLLTKKCFAFSESKRKFRSCNSNTHQSQNWNNAVHDCSDLLWFTTIPSAFVGIGYAAYDMPHISFWFQESWESSVKLVRLLIFTLIMDLSTAHELVYWRPDEVLTVTVYLEANDPR